MIENEDEGIHDLLKKAEECIINMVTPRIGEEDENDEGEEDRQAETPPLLKQDLGFSVPVIQEGPGHPGPPSGKKLRSTKTCCPKLMTNVNQG